MGDLDVGDRPRERDELPEPGRAHLLPRRRQRDRAPARLRLRRVREQGGRARGEPLRDDRRGRREPARARAPHALGRRAGDRRSGSAGRGSASRGEALVARRRASALDRERDVLVGRELVRRVADAAVEAADEEHRARDAGRGEDAGVVARARGELDDREARALDLGAQQRPERLAPSAPARSAAPGSKPIAATSASSRSASGARASTEMRTRHGIDVRPAGLDLELTDRRDRAVDPASGVADPRAPPRPRRRARRRGRPSASSRRARRAPRRRARRARSRRCP